MTRRDKLVEEYEDAFFALFMDTIAEEKGKLIAEEMEYLEQSCDFEVPIELDEKCHNVIKKAFAKDRRRKTKHTTHRIINKVALVAVISIILFTTTYAIFPEIRITTLNLLIEVSDVATGLVIGERNSSNEIFLNIENHQYYLPQLPSGFILDDEGSDARSAWCEYINEDGASIYFHIVSSLDTIFNVDTEATQSVKNIQVHGYDGLLIEKNERIQIVWGDTDKEIFVEIICIGIDRDEVQKLADGFVIE